MFFCSGFGFGQNNLSFSNDQYSGINSAPLSPTTPYFNPNKWDVSIFSTDILFQNDYAYISDQNIFGLLKGGVKTANPQKGITGESQANVLDFYKHDFVKYNLESDIVGPSFSFRQKIKGQTFRLGIFTRLRTQGSAKDIDNYMRFSNQKVIEPAEYSFQPLKTNFMNWNEFGLNVSTNLYTTNTQELIVGASIKYALALDAAYINSKNPIKLDAVLTSTSTLENPDADIYASNYDIEASYTTNYDFDKEKYVYKNRGNGVGIDLGIALVNRRINDELYDSKIALNLLDIGYVNLKGENHLFKNSTLVQIRNNPRLDDVDFKSIQQYARILSNEVYGDTLTSYNGNKFTIGLPTSLNFNLSKKVRPNHYINFNWVQRVPVFENSLKRTNILQTSYSIQKDGFGIGTSLSLYEYEKIGFGGYVRIGPLILGSENALPFVFKQNKLNSGSFYIGLKLYPFWDNEAKRRSREPCDCE